MAVLNPDYSVLNYEEMAKLIGLKVKHIPMLVGSFLEETEPLLTKLHTAIKDKDYALVRSIAHSIKGSAGNLRFTELYEMAKELEYAGAQSSTSFEYEEYFRAITAGVATIKI